MSTSHCSYVVRVPGQSPFTLGLEQPVLTLGRASTNDVVMEDGSVSRTHARMFLRDGEPWLEDLASRNGTTVNGLRIAGEHLLAPGDHIALGKVTLEVQPQTAFLAAPDSGQVSLLMHVRRLREHPSGSADPSQRRWQEALAILQEASVALMRQEPPELMLWGVLEHIFAFIKPGRGVVLIKDAQGRLNQVAARSSSQGHDFQIRLSSTMVEAALERHEAMLVNNPLLDARLGQAVSLVNSGVTTIMTVPLEYEGNVAGLVYLDGGPLREPFTEEDLKFVASLGHLAAAKLQHAHMAEELQKKRDMEKEMALARQIQERILPLHMAEPEGYACFGANVACKQVSGDLYGCWARPDGRIWIAIADVAGKGLGPGLLMAAFQAYLQAWSESYDDPAALALRLSRALAAKTTPNRYITAFLALLDPEAHTLTYTNAGHNPAVLLRGAGSREHLSSQGFPLAMFAGQPYSQGTLELKPGDLLCCYTDGITEATSPDDVEFGLEGLEGVLGTHMDLPLSDLHCRIGEALEAHTQGAPLTDDRTLVMLRRSPTGIPFRRNHS